MSSTEHPLPTLSPEEIRLHAKPESFRRGEEYARRGPSRNWRSAGTPSSPKWRAANRAEVAGSEPLPYEVRVAFEGRSVSVAACTCPCQWGGWCKHIVAALLAYRDAPGEVERRPSVDELLAGLSAEQLGGVVAGLVADNPAQLEPVERHVSWQRAPALGGADGDEQGPPKSSAPVDARAIRREVRGILRSLDHMRPSEAYWHGGSVVADVSHLLEQARAHLRNEDGRAALAVLR